MDDPGRDQFVRQVYPGELRAIHERRRVWGLDGGEALGADAAPDAAPDASHGTFGLALSGGGIRSATFNLGVLQVLAKHHLVQWLDYLSTVSGGGYVGSAFSVALDCEDPKLGRPGYSFVHEQGKEEPVTIKHLRRGRDYLAPDGLLDLLKIPAVLLRGLVTNLLVTAPYLVALAIYTAFLYPDLLDPTRATSYFRFHLPPDPQTGSSLHFFLFAPWLAIAFAAWIALFPLVSAIDPYPRFRWRDRYEKSFAALLLLLLTVPMIEAVPVLFRQVHLRVDGTDTGHFLSGAAAALLALVPTLRTLISSKKLAPLTGKLVGLLVVVLGPAIVLLLYLLFLHLLYTEAGGPLRADPGRMLLLGALAVATLAYTRLLVDVNKSGMHRFYRDRLSKAYLFDPYATGVATHRDRLRMSELDVRRSGAPYPLINTALNIQATSDPDLQGRGADFFLFTPAWSGSFATGYRETPLLERVDPDLNLGTCLAVSGAAAAPYMGTSSSKLTAFVLTLLNIRLDYWSPNPGWLGEWGRMGLAMRRLLYRVGPLYLLRELLGLLTANSRSVNLSDGGHIENLGLYELLRRRCRYILVTDAGHDPTLTLPSLGKVVAYARMDHGVRIEWTNLRELRLRPDGTTPIQWAHGTIHYDERQTGQIVYLKSSLSGCEPQDILTYKSKHETFPHQSTGDQFFDEEQFEAYRALGYFIAKQLFDGNPIVDRSPDEWFASLADKARQSHSDESATPADAPPSTPSPGQTG